LCFVRINQDLERRTAVNYEKSWALDFSSATSEGNAAVSRYDQASWAREAPSPGLEPELSEPKSEVLPITPRRIAGPAIEPRPL
jgi:hypothetical protein